MKKVLAPQDLRNFSKEVRQVIKAKQAQAEQAFLNDVRQVLSQDSISQDAFKALFKANNEFVFFGSNSTTKEVVFKKDGTPDLRSLPMNVRQLFKTLQAEAKVRRELAASQVLAKETISVQDLMELQRIGKTNIFKQKFSSTAA